MYAFIKGILEEKTTDSVVIDAHGVGYHIFVTATALSQMGEIGEKVKVYTHLSIRDDAHVLFGFASSEERRMFHRLISVSGIGPKIGMGILSFLNVGDLAIALVTGDISALSRVPGIGKKSAQRLILELKEKVGNDEIADGTNGIPVSAMNHTVQEAVSALMALGYSSSEAVKTIDCVKQDHQQPEDMIRAALRQLDSRAKERRA